MSVISHKITYRHKTWEKKRIKKLSIYYLANPTKLSTYKTFSLNTLFRVKLSVRRGEALVLTSDHPWEYNSPKFSYLRSSSPWAFKVKASQHF